MNALASLILPTDKLSHTWTVAGTILMGGAVTLTAWWMSTSGLAELAATAVAFWILTLVRMLSPGLQRLAPGEMKASAGLIDTLRRDISAWMGSRSILSQAIIAALLTAAFLVLRAGARWVLTALSSPILAGAVGLAVAALVAAPHLARAVGEAATQRRTSDTDTTDTADSDTDTDTDDHEEDR